jgi:CelD/BcsL family acetyltransferase involved in cellulose biosynthesis
VPLNNGCQFDIVRSASDLASLQEEWNNLLHDSESTIFQTHEYASTWWEYHGGGRELFCFVVRCSGKIVGIVPLFREKMRLPFLRDLQRLRYIGSPLTEYEHPIVMHESERAVVDTFCSYLADHPKEWDILDIESLSEQSLLLPVVQDSLGRNNLRQYLYQGSASAQVQLSPSVEEFLAARNKRLRHEYRRKWKGISQQFQVRIENFEEPGEELTAAMPSFFEIHDARWKSLGFPPEFEEQSERDFLTTLVKRFALRKWLRLSFLVVDGVRVAANLEFPYSRTVYVLHSQASGPDDIMKYSPGYLIKMKGIERAIEEHRAEYDLLRGEHAYKYRDFDALPRKNWMVRTRSTGRGSGLRFAVFLALEFLGKIRRRALNEYYESRRFRVANGSSPMVLVRYALRRSGTLLGTAWAYLRRHLKPEAGTTARGQGEQKRPGRMGGVGEVAHRRSGLREFPVGQTVRVKSEQEIRATLDSMQCSQGLPFMPEMVEHCGKELRVSGWAHKTCVEGYGLRHLGNAVFLDDVRCTGIHHDGCQRACLLFWRLDWLEPAKEAHRGDRSSSGAADAGFGLPDYLTKDGSRYICQSTQLVAATRSLPWWNLGQYMRDVSSGQLSLSIILKGVKALYGNKIRGIMQSASSASIHGVLQRTPQQSVGLSPGEGVKVKGRAAIVATLDREGKNRGLEFAPEMAPLCGGSMNVQARVSKIILEQTGEMREVQDTVILEGAYCDGVERRWCPRKNLFLWREIWLEREIQGGPSGSREGTQIAASTQEPPATIG